MVATRSMQFNFYIWPTVWLLIIASIIWLTMSLFYVTLFHNSTFLLAISSYILLWNALNRYVFNIMVDRGDTVELFSFPLITLQVSSRNVPRSDISSAGRIKILNSSSHVSILYTNGECKPPNKNAVYYFSKHLILIKMVLSEKLICRTALRLCNLKVL